MSDKQKGKSHHHPGVRAPYSSSRKGIGGRKKLIDVLCFLVNCFQIRPFALLPTIFRLTYFLVKSMSDSESTNWVETDGKVTGEIIVGNAECPPAEISMEGK